MKNYVISMVCAFFALVSTAGYSQVNVLERWNITPKHNISYKSGGTADLQLFQRIIGMQGRVYPVASISYIRQDIKVNDRIDYRDLVAKFQLGYGVLNWNVKNHLGSKIFSGKLPEQSRNVRISITEKHKEIIVSVATFRRGYANVVEKEIVQIQDGLSKLKAKSIAQTIFETLVIGSAYADDLDLGSILDSIPGTGMPGGSGIVLPSIDGGLDMSASIDISGEINTTVTGGMDQGQFDALIDRTDALTQTSNDAISTMNEQGDAANANWSDTNQQISIANQNAENAIKVADKQGTAANANWAETNRVIDKNWDNTNKQIARTNDIAEKMSDPKHMMLLSGATAAGAVFGASLANLAIDGLKLGLDFIIEQITDTKGKAKRWALFADARKKWNQTLKHALNLEKSIDNFIGYYDVFKTLKEKDPSANIETIIRHFSKEAYKAKKIRDKYETKLAEAETLECEDRYAEKLVEQDAIIDQLESVRDILKKHMKENPDQDIFDERFFCNQLGNMIRNLLDAESTLQDYRIFMIDGKAEFGEALKDQAEKIYDASEHYNKNKKSSKSRELKQEKERYEMALNQLEGLADKRCKQKGVAWVQRSGCIEQELTKGSLYRRKGQIEKKLKVVNDSIEMSYSDDGMLSVNEKVISDRIQHYNDWFKEIEGQQHCSQYPEDSACREMSKFAYNGNFYMKEKAMNRIEDVCPNQEMNVYDVKQRMSEEGQPEISVVDPEANNKEVLRIAPAAPKKSKGKGFFSSLFKSVKSFFGGVGESIGNFFGGAGKSKTVGESRPVFDGTQARGSGYQSSPFIPRQEPITKSVVDERVTRTNPKTLKTLYPNAYFGLVKVEPSPSDQQIAALTELMKQDYVKVPKSDEFAYGILEKAGYIQHGILDMNKLKESGDVDTFKLFVSLIIDTKLK
jgi:hypothetical protein